MAVIDNKKKEGLLYTNLEPLPLIILSVILTGLIGGGIHAVMNQ
ncbi:MAG: hypothetical protein ACE5F4_02300 [Candidatus Paceibacteria bacterium]